MSNVFRDLDVSAYQRWELASFDHKPPVSKETSRPAIPPPVAMISEAELAQIREHAHQEGYSAGYQEAYERGLREGQEAGYAASEENMKPEIESVQSLLQNLSLEISAIGTNTGKELLELAISLAEKILRVRLDLDEQVIIPIVQEAIGQLPPAQQSAQLILNPVDAVIIKSAIGDQLSSEGWRISIDNDMARGGCKIETSQNLIDASFEARWQKLTDMLRQQHQ